MTPTLRRLATTAAVAITTAAVVACEKHEYERPDRTAQVAEADSLLTPETFDTVTWASNEQRAFEGNNTYSAHCRSCHGFMGDGDTDYAREHDLNVPSLVRADFPWGDVESIRRRIFTGHPSGMPTWGVAGITPREIDAAAYYIVHVLRPEVLR
jgi:mono/diheme cytochrome c family protein